MKGRQTWSTPQRGAARRAVRPYLSLPVRRADVRGPLSPFLTRARRQRPHQRTEHHDRNHLEEHRSDFWHRAAM